MKYINIYSKYLSTKKNPVFKSTLPNTDAKRVELRQTMI